MLRRAILAASCFLALLVGPSAQAAPVRSLKVTVLSTMLADDGIGEWGFSALVEADGHRVLFDTGAYPDTVLRNARELGIDLSGVQDVVLSHNHDDHTGGLVALRRALREKDPAALSRAHVARGIFWPRPGADGKEDNPMIATRQAYQALGGRFIERDGPAQLFPGVWLTGPVPRVHPERNWSGSHKVRTPTGLAEDNLPEDQSLVVEAPAGLVVVAGCGHAGIINTLEYAQARVKQAPVYAALGGFHLFAARDEVLDWTASRLRALGVRHFIGAHCTGIEAVYRLREKAGLDRRTCVVGAVGQTFTLDRGIDPRRLAR